MLGTGWRDKKTITFVSTAGSAGLGMRKERQRPVYDAVSGEVDYQTEFLERPGVVELFQNVANMNDIHNQRRQGTLALEEAWRTKKWRHRVIATILAMIVVDAYLAYRFECKGESQVPMSQYQFVELLAQALLTNQAGRRASRGVPGNNRDADGGGAPLAATIAIRNHDMRKRRRATRHQMYCVVCRMKCSYACSVCSAGDAIIPTCGPGTGRLCELVHRQQSHAQ